MENSGIKYVLYELECADKQSLTIQYVTKQINDWYSEMLSSIDASLIYFYPTHDLKLYFSSSSNKNCVNQLPDKIKLKDNRLIFKKIEIETNGFVIFIKLTLIKLNKSLFNFRAMKLFM